MAGMVIAGVPSAVAAYFVLKANDLVCGHGEDKMPYGRKVNGLYDNSDLPCHSW